MNNLTSNLREFSRLYRIKNPDFPFFKCADVSWELNKRYELFVVSGAYYGKFDERFKNVKLEKKVIAKQEFPCFGHYFNYDSKRKVFIDLTACQFNSSLPDILVLNENDKRIAMNWSTINDNTLFLPYDIYDLGKNGKIKPVHDMLKPCYMRDSLMNRFRNN